MYRRGTGLSWMDANVPRQNPGGAMDRETIALVFTGLYLLIGTKYISKFATWATKNVDRQETAYYVLGTAITVSILLFVVLMLST
jgi:phosphatidylserine synthase